MNQRKAKRELLLVLATILQKDDDLFPDELDLDNPREYEPWNKAREELVEEFERRGKSATR